jgi:hypothetical protein
VTSGPPLGTAPGRHGAAWWTCPGDPGRRHRPTQNAATEHRRPEGGRRAPIGESVVSRRPKWRSTDRSGATARQCPGTSTRRVPLRRSWDNGGSARVLNAAPSRRRSRSAFGSVDQALVQPAATPPSSNAGDPKRSLARVAARRHRRPRRRHGAVVTAAALAVPLGTVPLVMYVDRTTMNWRYPGPDEQGAWRRNFPTPSGCTARRPGTRSRSAVAATAGRDGSQVILGHSELDPGSRSTLSVLGTTARHRLRRVASDAARGGRS